MPQCAEVFLSNGAKQLILFDVGTLRKALRHPVKVDAKTSCQVNHALTFTCNLRLIASSLLRGALFHIEMRGIDDSFDLSPRRQFPSSSLSTCNLLQGHLKVHLCVLRTLQSQLPYVVICMLMNEFPRLLID